MTWDREPALIVAFVQALITLAVVFGAHITSAQSTAIIGVVIAALAVVGGLVTRSQVTPTSGATSPPAVDLTKVGKV